MPSNMRTIWRTKAERERTESKDQLGVENQHNLVWRCKRWSAIDNQSRMRHSLCVPVIQFFFFLSVWSDFFIYLFIVKVISDFLIFVRVLLMLVHPALKVKWQKYPLSVSHLSWSVKVLRINLICRNFTDQFDP